MLYVKVVFVVNIAVSLSNHMGYVKRDRFYQCAFVHVLQFL